MTKLEGTIAPLGDKNEIIVSILRELGKPDSVKWRIFNCIYGRGSRPKTVDDISVVTGIDRQVIQNTARNMASHGIIERVVLEKNRVAYKKQVNIVGLKQKLNNLAGKKPKIDKIPTKWDPNVSIRGIRTNVVRIPSDFYSVKSITVDEIDSFERVKDVRGDRIDMATISEDAFKAGVQAIIKEEATFRDWGGETSDLMTTRVRVGGKRVSAAFAFKGPGRKGKLVPSAMGKNGDQAQRLIQESADVFIVQHWTDVDPSVHRLMEQLAIAKSATTGREVRFCIIDGNDSARIVEAYPEVFGLDGGRPPTPT